METTRAPLAIGNTSGILVSAYQYCWSDDDAAWWMERFNALMNNGELPEYTKLREENKKLHEENAQFRTILFETGIWRSPTPDWTKSGDVYDLFKAVQEFYEEHGSLPTDLIRRRTIFV